MPSLMNPTFPCGVSTCKAAHSVKIVGTTESQRPGNKLRRLARGGGATRPLRVTLKVLPLASLSFFLHKLFIVK